MKKKKKNPINLKKSKNLKQILKRKKKHLEKFCSLSFAIDGDYTPTRSVKVTPEGGGGLSVTKNRVKKMGPILAL